MRKKIALVFICLNAPYWPFLKDVIEDARKHFLTNHQVDFFTWSDMPELGSKEFEDVLAASPTRLEVNNLLKKDFFDFSSAHPEMDLNTCLQTWHQQSQDKIAQVNRIVPREKLKENIEFLRSQENIHVIPTEPASWPVPTLMRYHLFLNEEDRLKEYDYIFYLDVDMRIVDTVGDEILGEGITMAEHPMYSLRREYVPPYEPNKDSTAFVPRFGCVINEGGKPRFKPLYAAGGFQGGTSKSFIEAMKVMREKIDRDFNNNYTAIWNDESHWNRYLYGYSGHITVLSPSYVYPDSLIKEYYEKIWGCNFKPIIITLTKKFTTSKENGDDLRNRLSTM